MYPWGVIFRRATREGFGVFLFWEVIVFIVFLFAGYMYLFRKGAFKWQ